MKLESIPDKVTYIIISLVWIFVAIFLVSALVISFLSPAVVADLFTNIIGLPNFTVEDVGLLLIAFGLLVPVVLMGMFSLIAYAVMIFDKLRR